MKDASLMLEWMHDESVVENLNTDFSVKTLEDCFDFIQSSQQDKNNLHLAITDDFDTYMGTISLKHIENQTAEFGIALRSIAMGKGYAKAAMKEILNKGFREMNLLSVYWCVDPKNKRAVRFYEKNGYKQTSPDVLRVGEMYTKIHNYIWYCQTKS